MNKLFHERRRQVFVTEEYFRDYSKYLEEERDYWKDGLQAIGDSESERRMLARMTYSNFSYSIFSLRYTAGIPIEELRTELTSVIEAYEHYQKALIAYEGRPGISPGA